MKFFSNLRRRGLALFLVLTMCMTLLPAQALAAAETRTDGTVGEVSSTDQNVKVTKTAEPKPGTDKATITMEAYVNGKATTTTTTTHAPLDIVLVLDQSTSMNQNGNNRLATLKSALKNNSGTGFVQNIQKDAQENSVDHKIAIVGFGSSRTSRSSYDNTRWLNTGLFVDGTWKQYATGNTDTSQLTRNDYEGALVLANVSKSLNPSIGGAVDKLQALGTTNTLYGLKMAGEVFRYNSGENRQRVVVLFTDGATDSDRNEVLKEANALKSQYNATVYTVALGTSDENEFLQHISSNYTTASYTSGWYGGYAGTHAKDENGKNITKYSMTANNNSELANIFETFSQDITTLTPAVEVTETAVLKDQLSPQFTFDDSVKFENGIVTEGVTVYSVAAKGTGDAPDWDVENKADITKNVSIKVTGSAEDKTIQVEGFDYSDEANFVIKQDGEWQGHKLMFVFDVKPDTGYEHWGESNTPVNTNVPGASLEQGEDVKVEVKDPTEIEQPGTPSITVPTYTVSYDLSYGDNQPTTDGKHYVKDTKVSVTEDPSREGYTFTGWTVTGAALENGTITIGTSDVTLTAGWQINTHSVTYGYTGTVPADAPSAPAAVQKNYNDPVTVADAPALDGYTFSGWTTASAGAPNSGTFNMPDNDVAFTGSWTANTDTKYRIEYYQQNAEDDGYTLVDENSKDMTGTTGAQVSIAEMSYTGFEENTKHQDRLVEGNIKGDGTLVLKRYYDRKTYTVSYGYEGTVPEGASALPASATVRYGASVDVKAAATADGYTFSGWNAQGVTVEGGKFTMPDSDVEFTGYFAAATGTAYKVEHYWQNGDQYVLHETENLTGMTDLEVTATAKNYLTDGYVFNAKAVGTIQSGTITGDGKLTLKLYYDKRTDLAYVVYFQEKGTGTELRKPDMVTGQSVGTEVKAEDVAKNYTISGYTYDSSNCKDGVLTISGGRNEMILYYTSNPTYTVKYVDEFGDEIAEADTFTADVAVGETVTATAKDIAGYTYDATSNNAVVITGDSAKNVITLRYTKNATTARVEVKHLDASTNQPIAAGASVVAEIGSTITAEELTKANVSGYTYVGASVEKLVVEGTIKNEIILYYDKQDAKVSYTVNYYKGSISEDNLVTKDEGSGKVGEQIPYDLAKCINLVISGECKLPGTNDVTGPNGKPGPVVITADAENNILNVVYPLNRIYSYTIEYYRDEVNANNGHFLGQDTVNDCALGEKITLNQEQLNARKPDASYGDGVQQGTVPYVITAGRNVLQVLYTKSAVGPTEYTVTYKWTGAPEEAYYSAPETGTSTPVVLSLPKDSQKYVEGSAYPVASSYKQGSMLYECKADAEGKLYLTGTWTFSGWKLGGEVVTGNQTMGSSNVELTGEWTYQPMGTHSVTYEWVGNRAPEGVNPPVGQTGLYPGNRFVVADVAHKSVERKDSNGETLGTWTFLGWTGYVAGAECAMGRDDVVISGEWEYVPVPIYNKDDSANNDLNVTKTSDDQNVAIGSTVTWVIEIENTRDDMTYSGLSLEEYLTGVYGQEVLTGEDNALGITGMYYRSAEDPYIGFGGEAVTLPDEIEVREDEETTDPEIVTQPETAPEAEKDPVTDPEPEATPEQAPVIDPEIGFGQEVPAAFNPDTQIMSRGFIHFSMAGYDDIDAGFGVDDSMEVADWRNFNLGPNDVVVFVVEYTVQDGDQDLINQVIVKRGGETLGGDTADEIKVVEPAPSVTVKKTPVVPDNGYVAGDDVQWIITVTNNTKYPVEGLSLTDDTLVGVTVTGTLEYTNFALAAEGKTSFLATLADAPAGTYTNAVVVSKDGEKLGEDEADPVKVSGLFTVTYTDGVSGTAFATQTYSNRVEGTATPDFSGTPTREGYVFTGWSPAVAGTVTGNVTYTAQWVSATVPNPSFTVVKTADRTTASVGDVITYTITVTNNGNVDLTNIVVSDPMMENGGTTIASLPVGGEPVVFTYTHTVTLTEAGTTLPNTVTVRGTNPNPGQENPAPTEDTVTTDINPIAPPPIVIPTGPIPLAPGGDTILDDEVPLAAPGLNSTDHFDYVKGYEDGTVRPEANITRAEVATIFFRLMTNEFRMENWATENSFSDVAFGTWYNNAISTATKAGILTGYPEGDFRPENSITRAEFASIAARFASEEVTQRGRFSDIQGHWAEENIERAAAAGWITGSEGKFRPDDYITRAEVIVAVNRMLDRVPDEDHLLDGMKTFVDNVPGMWYYADVQEATNSHDYDRDETGISEVWTELKPDQDWTALEKEWADAAAANVADVAANLNGGSESEGETEGEAETETKTED